MPQSRAIYPDAYGTLFGISRWEPTVGSMEDLETTVLCSQRLSDLVGDECLSITVVMTEQTQKCSCLRACLGALEIRWFCRASKKRDTTKSTE